MQYELFTETSDISSTLDWRNIYLSGFNRTSDIITLNHSAKHVTRLLNYRLVSRETIRKTLTSSIFIYSKPKFKSYVR